MIGNKSFVLKDRTNDAPFSFGIRVSCSFKIK
jgi:hypothetical protein